MTTKDLHSDKDGGNDTQKLISYITLGFSSLTILGSYTYEALHLVGNQVFDEQIGMLLMFLKGAGMFMFRLNDAPTLPFLNVSTSSQYSETTAGVGMEGEEIVVSPTSSSQWPSQCSKMLVR